MWKSVRLLLLLLVCSSSPISGDILLNGFRHRDFTVYGDASVAKDPPPSLRSHLSLTNLTEFSIGRALYPSKISLTSSSSSSLILPFYASFLFSIASAPSVLPGHGLAFLLSPVAGLRYSSPAQHLGLFNRTTNGDPSNGVLAVEFDVFRNQEFGDIDENHVGIDIHSLSSVISKSAGYYSGDNWIPLQLNNGWNYQAWVDYSAQTLNVTIAPVSLGRKPERPLISHRINLSNFLQPEMYVGFCAATGVLKEWHRVLGFSFSNSNSTLSTGLITTDLPNFAPRLPARSNHLAVIFAVAIAAAVVLVLVAWAARSIWQRRSSWVSLHDEVEEWESGYWPHRVRFRDISKATGGLAEENLIGSGGEGKVYRGVLDGEMVAVKRFWRGDGEEARGFLAEVSTLGRLRHRNLVGFKGWCKRGGELFLLHEYMENGNLEGKLGAAEPLLDWPTRVGILKDVALGVLYLHEGWERRVVHRDIKASNVLLDGRMVGKLGDFGLARVHDHRGPPRTSAVVGTAGYMAPEIVSRGRATAAADVYAFGVLVLEVASGRKGASEEGREPLVRSVWEEVARSGSVGGLVDPRLAGTEGYDEGQAAELVKLGMWCTCEDSEERPTMREVVTALDGGRSGIQQEVAVGVGSWRPCRNPRREKVTLSSCSYSSLSLTDELLEGR